jgi:phosphatidylglycerol lysyltransferase
MSHFLGSIVGLLLILLAHAIQRRVRAAWGVSVALLAIACLSALAKGGDWQEAIVPGSILLALLPARREFHRRAPMLSRSLSPTWFVATGAALASALWLGLFSYKGIRFEDQLWWQFAASGDASRFLRAAVAVGVVTLCAAILHLITVTGRHGARSPEADDA